jgi:tyrosine-protein kinase Etk/Wzc
MNQNKPVAKNQKLVETKDLVFIWKLLLKNIIVLIFVPLLSYGVGYIYTYRLTDVYGSKVQLLLKSNETYDYQDPIYKGLGAYAAYTDIQNQIRVLQSKDFIGEIVDKINGNTSYSVVGRLKKKEVFETLPFKVDAEILNYSIYETPMNIIVKDKDHYTISYLVGGLSKSVTQSFDSLYINEDFKIVLKQQYEFNDDNIGSIIDSEYEIINHSHVNVVGKYRSRISIENLEYTSIIEIKILDELQYRGKRFLDTLTSVYIDYSKRIQLEVNQNTLENIEKQLDTISKFIQDKEIELLRYKDENAILHLSKEENEYFQKYVQYTKLKRDLTHKINSLKSLETYIIGLEDEHFLPPSFIVLKEDFYLNKTTEKIYQLQLDLKSRENSQLANNDNVIKLKKEISILKKDILIYIDNLKKVLANEISDVDIYISTNKSNIKKIPVSEQGISNIKRELDVNNKMYLFLLEKKTNTLIARAGIIPQVRVVEKASVLGVVQPDKTKLIRLFVLGGIVFALLIAVVRKLFFEKIENVTELAETTSLTIMGGLPFIKELDSKLIVTQKPKAQITESFRTLRTNLSYLGDSNEESAKVVLVSSFFPGEGKTFTSTNTAALIAMSDKRVLIIDFDLHKPKIHKSFEIENTKGVSSLMIGKHTLDEVIHENLKPNLDVVTAGPIPPNPSELIMKKQMDDLFAEIRLRYDYVIVDTPPFGLLNDSIELMKFVDAFVVVLNTKVVRRKGIHAIEELLTKNKEVSLGLVLNGIRKTRFQYYYSKYTYKYNYNYGYNYGYGYGDSYSDYVDDKD